MQERSGHIYWRSLLPHALKPDFGRLPGKSQNKQNKQSATHYHTLSMCQSNITNFKISLSLSLSLSVCLSLAVCVCACVCVCVCFLMSHYYVVNTSGIARQKRNKEPQSNLFLHRNKLYTIIKAALIRVTDMHPNIQYEVF